PVAPGGVGRPRSRPDRVGRNDISPATARRERVAGSFGGYSFPDSPSLRPGFCPPNDWTRNRFHRFPCPRRRPSHGVLPDTVVVGLTTGFAGRAPPVVDTAPFLTLPGVP